VLIISARRSEFEAGFDRGGQTREHAMLAKTLGVQKLVVCVNKMDEQTVKWSKSRYDQIVKKLTPFLKKTRFKPKDVTFLPVSAYTGANLMEPCKKSECDWYKGPCFMDILDGFKTKPKNADCGLRMPVLGHCKEMGSLSILGKVEAGQVWRGQKLVIAPTGQTCECVGLTINEKPVDMANPGENVAVQVKGIDEADINPGFVLCQVDDPGSKCLSFEAQMVVSELLKHKPLMTAGYMCMLHCHTIAVPCKISKLLYLVGKKEGKTKKPNFVKKGQVCEVKIKIAQTACIEVFKQFPQLGRFTLRDEGKTIAIGKVLKLKPFKSKQ
jgi:peptide chain release factor subunit 3